MRPAPIILFLFGSLAVILGGWTARQEADQYFSAGLPGTARLAGLVQGSIQPGVSLEANRFYADACLDAVARLDARMLPPPDAQRLTEACLVKIGALAEQSPVNSFLWVAHARLAFLAQDFPAMNESLVLSRASGPNEYWIAARRFELGERAFRNLSPEAAREHELNLVMLAETAKGISLLATRYVAAPDFRPRITAVMETLSPSRQRLFLSTVGQVTAQSRAAP